MCTCEKCRKEFQGEVNRIKYDLKRDLKGIKDIIRRVETEVEHINGSVKESLGRVRDLEEESRHKETSCPFREDILSVKEERMTAEALKHYVAENEQRQYRKTRNMAAVLTAVFAAISFLFHLLT